MRQATQRAEPASRRTGKVSVNGNAQQRISSSSRQVALQRAMQMLQEVDTMTAGKLIGMNGRGMLQRLTTLDQRPVNHLRSITQLAQQLLPPRSEKGELTDTRFAMNFHLRTSLLQGTPRSRKHVSVAELST
jgi:hypothetical protein